MHGGPKLVSSNQVLAKSIVYMLILLGDLGSDRDFFGKNLNDDLLYLLQNIQCGDAISLW